MRENNNLTGRRGLSGSSLKIIACVSMFLDHFCKILLFPVIFRGILFPLIENGTISAGSVRPFYNLGKEILLPLGRTAFPLFCFLLAEGFAHTGNRRRYCLSLLLFAFLSEIPFDLAFNTERAREAGTFPLYFGYQNVYFTLFLGLSCLCMLEWLSRYGNRLIGVLLQMICVWGLARAADFLCSDYGAKGVLFIVAFYLLRESRYLQIGGFLALYLLFYKAIPPVGIWIAVLLILLYSGQRGRIRHKYFFYWFYPAHLLLLYLTAFLIKP